MHGSIANDSHWKTAHQQASPLHSSGEWRPDRAGANRIELGVRVTTAAPHPGPCEPTEQYLNFSRACFCNVNARSVQGQYRRDRTCCQYSRARPLPSGHHLAGSATHPPPRATAVAAWERLSGRRSAIAELYRAAQQYVYRAFLSSCRRARTMHEIDTPRATQMPAW